MHPKIFYKIFDKEYKNSTLFFSKFKAQSESDLGEINRNLECIKQNLNVANLLILKQVHGTQVADADNIKDCSQEIEADAAVTCRRSLSLSVQTADCAPVLLASDCGKIIAAAHCGWRSAKGGIVEKVVNIMKDKGANNIKACIGPSIKQNSYEVDGNFYNNFLEDNAMNLEYFKFSNNPNKYLFDLPKYIQNKLKECGINDIRMSNDDTYLMHHKYPSFRYSTHNDLPDKARILSTIYIC